MHENSCKDSVVTPVLPTRKLSLGNTKAANVVGKALREAKKIIDAKQSLSVTKDGYEGSKVRLHVGMDTAGIQVL